MFLQTLKPRSSDVLLDVGGHPGFWLSNPQPVARIDTLNIYDVPWTNTDAPNHNITTLTGDGCSLNMENESYDIGFSNSVIEHVSSWERQMQFASEIRRVSKSLWVQTPAYGCPIEPHYLTPFIHYFPRSFQKKLIRWFTLRGWIERPNRQQVAEMVDTTRLLRKREMKLLFPDCEILTERMLGFIPKSYIAVRKHT